MTDRSAIEGEVRRCLVEMFLRKAEAETLQNDTDLLRVLDSLQVLRLVIELESLFTIKVSDSDLTLDNLGSIARIAAFVGRKCGALDTGREELLAQDG
jgi:acyl carrier protein